MQLTLTTTHKKYIMHTMHIQGIGSQMDFTALTVWHALEPLSRFQTTKKD